MNQYHCVLLHAIEIPTHDISIFPMAKHLFAIDQNLTRKQKAEKYNLKIILLHVTSVAKKKKRFNKQLILMRLYI